MFLEYAAEQWDRGDFFSLYFSFIFPRIYTPQDSYAWQMREQRRPYFVGGVIWERLRVARQP
jgi:hypothetical protein